MRHLAGYTVQNAELSISHRCFGVFYVFRVSHRFFSVFWPTLDFLHMPAWTFSCLSAPCRGARGDDVHANADSVLWFWCGTSVGVGGDGRG